MIRMFSKNIPECVNRQLKRKLNVNFSRYGRMVPRKLSLEGADCRFILKVPGKNSNVVMTADFLVANEMVKRDNSNFRKKPVAFDNGSRITYQFTNWTQVEQFLDRLPERMPSNQVTIPIANGVPLTIHDFLNHIDYGGWYYQCSYQPVSGMKKLKDELRDFGIAA